MLRFSDIMSGVNDSFAGGKSCGDCERSIPESIDAKFKEDSSLNGEAR